MSGPADNIFSPSEADLSRCVRCGLCLQNCPTYVLTGLEAESPRGRLYLMRALSEGVIEPTSQVSQHLDSCLQCRNCEAVCPSGVPYGRIMERTRATLLHTGRRPLSWKLRAAFLREVIGKRAPMRAFATLLRLTQVSGLHAIAERLPIVGSRATLAPRMTPRPYTKRGVLGQPKGAVRARVGLLTGCIMPYAYGRVHSAVVDVLVRNGCEVIAPKTQVCCGALHAHNGDLPTASKLARQNFEAFLDQQLDAIIIDSAGCGAAMKEYGELIPPGQPDHDQAERFSSLVRDISEFLVQLPFEPPTGQLEATVTYQDSCHLAHAQRITRAPRQVLESIPGLRFVEMEYPDRCCGSAGVYSLTQAGMSLDLIDSKMTDINATSAGFIATSNPGCMAQLEAGVRRTRSRARVVHVVELLAKAYRADRR